MSVATANVTGMQLD